MPSRIIIGNILLAIVVSVLIVVPVLAGPALLYEYNMSPGNPTRIQDIRGVADLSTISEGCHPSLLAGRIEAVEYSANSKDLPRMFRMRRDDGFLEGIDLDALRSVQLSMVDVSWLGKFFAPGRKVLVIGMRCGASGHEFVARDIYDERYIANTLSRRQKR
jgi:hypothetical protein